MTAESRPMFRNRILIRLSEQRVEVLANIRPIELPLGMVLREPGGDDRLVYFIEEGMASATALTSQGTHIEVGLIGREGFVGVGSVLGHPGMPHHTMMQVGGRGYAMPTEMFRTEFSRPGPVMAAVHDFLYAQLIQASQTALCNRVHETEPRLAKWLLTTSDIIDSDTLHITQEFMAQMIGAERSTVTIAAGTLRSAGLIEYRRGLVEIVNRPMLEDAACECYHVLRKEYARIYGGDHSSVG
jgi:CRP-like cAMP-binding protein